jgi:hypothetical protein
VDFAPSGGLVPSGRGKMLNKLLEHLEHLEHLHKTNNLDLENFVHNDQVTNNQVTDIRQ